MAEVIDPSKGVGRPERVRIDGKPLKVHCNDIIKLDDGRIQQITITDDPINGGPPEVTHGPVGGNGRVCFITTAVCKTLNKPDDCQELTKFRRFRDSFMQETTEMQSEVQEYYNIAPQICYKIDKNGNKFATEKYSLIWEESLKPAFDALDSGQDQKAYAIYKKMVLDLKKEFFV